MKYLVLLIGDGEVTPWDEQTPEERASAEQRIMADRRAKLDAMAAAGGEPLDAERPRVARRSRLSCLLIAHAHRRPRADARDARLVRSRPRSDAERSATSADPHGPP